tara:strand:+ start:49 stop:693 length:645 start_codon:yes stop_codon:yes gene_type:complete
MKLIIFIHTCEAYEEKRAKLLEDSWALANMDIVFITDNPNSKLLNKIYVGSYKKGATYHPTSVKKMIDIWLTNYADYDYYLMIDDDSYLFVDKLKHFLSSLNSQDCLMIGDIFNWIKIDTGLWNPNKEWWIGGGPGIVFTKSCLEEFKRLYTINEIRISNHDVWLHDLYLKSNIIKRVHCPGFHQYPSMIKSTDDLISIHLNHDMSLLKNYPRI